MISSSTRDDIYGQIPYSSIVEAVKKRYLRQECLETVATSYKRKYDARETEDIFTYTEELISMTQKARKTKASQQAGPSQRERDRSETRDAESETGDGGKI